MGWDGMGRDGIGGAVGACDGVGWGGRCLHRSNTGSRDITEGGQKAVTLQTIGWEKNRGSPLGLRNADGECVLQSDGMGRSGWGRAVCGVGGSYCGVHTAHSAVR